MAPQSDALKSIKHSMKLIFARFWFKTCYKIMSCLPNSLDINTNEHLKFHLIYQIHDVMLPPRNLRESQDKLFYREDDTSTISFADVNEENLNAYASPIAFHPPMLNFHLRPVGMPHMERVIIQNLSPDTSIHMLSISGNTLHTHCSFFQEKVIPPGGNTSFDVVLLAREEGPVEDTLFIHTSLGSFKFQLINIIVIYLQFYDLGKTESRQLQAQQVLFQILQKL
ncbi:transmembrane protein 131 [Trichonephila clavipes]|nr:transmembrane protein 131 [Trichonephila clavipes]